MCPTCTNRYANCKHCGNLYDKNYGGVDDNLCQECMRYHAECVLCGKAMRINVLNPYADVVALIPLSVYAHKECKEKYDKGDVRKCPKCSTITVDSFCSVCHTTDNIKRRIKEVLKRFSSLRTRLRTSGSEFVEVPSTGSIVLPEGYNIAR